MTDTIATRVGRIISGSVNALLDAVEGAAPEAIMEQAIREIDLAIDDVREELGRASAAKHLANKRLAEKNAAHEDLAGKIEIALDQNREDLAQAAVESQLDIEAQMPVLEQTIIGCQEREKELEGFIAALQPDAHFGRVLAAYGGVFVAGSLAWGIVVDGFRPTMWDYIGSAVALVGAGIIVLAPSTPVSE